LDKIRVLVLQTSCNVNNTRIINLVNNSLEKLNIFSADILEINYFDVNNWDSASSIVISPSPISTKLKSQVLVIPTAYVGLMNQDNFDVIFEQCVKNILCTSQIGS
jgi:hypothetical protein